MRVLGLLYPLRHRMSHRAHAHTCTCVDTQAVRVDGGGEGAVGQCLVGPGSEPEDQHVRPGPAFLPALTDSSPLVEAEKGAGASVKGSTRPWGLRWGVGQGSQNPTPFLEYGAAPETAANSHGG